MSEQQLTYKERAAEAAAMQAIIASSSHEAGSLQKKINDLQRAQKTVESALEIEIEPDGMAELQYRLDAAWDRHRQAQLRLAELERKQAAAGEIKVIHQTGTRAQIVIHYLRDDGKRVSFTRHVRLDGTSWKGNSTLTDQRVTYQLTRAQLAQAA
jgi:hypothetical protein